MKRLGFVFLFCGWAVVSRAQNIDSVIHQADSLSEQPEKALTLLNQAIAAYPESEELLKVRAETYSHLKQYAKAADDYRKITAFVPDDETVWYQLGYHLYESKQYEAAISSVDKAIQLNKQYLPAYHVKIKSQLQLNQPEAALKTSNATLQIGETAMNYFLQGEVNNRINARQQAEWAYTKATRLDRGFIEAYIALSNLSAGMNKTEETLVNADAALAINPDSEEAMVARSRGYALLKQFKDAIDDASYVLEKNPNNLQARYRRGTYYLETNKNQEALKDFEWVMKADPTFWQALAGRADSYAGTGNKKAALTDYQQLLADAPKYPDREAITQLAHQRIFELNRENRAPQLTLDGIANDNFVLPVPDNAKTVTLKGKITDESPVGKFRINGQDITLTPIDDGFEFTDEVKLENNVNEIQLEVADVYDNVNKLTYHIVKTETVKPEITLFTPKPDEKGSITIAADSENHLYIEGKITDESHIIDIKVDEKAIDFDHDNPNPTFSTIVDITNKTAFNIKATDRYGNTTEQVFAIERIALQISNNN
ncbi:MAG: tetratricopeptide repeat protein [Bacteroidales bacterium]|jgi:tetratricopeptide (TPR) repeat protein|nr:tetratricopeptide repeat protein [Bacteroidales bacterium]